MTRKQWRRVDCQLICSRKFSRRIADGTEIVWDKETEVCPGAAARNIE